MRPLEKWNHELLQELDSLKKEHRYRTLRSGQFSLDFSSNDYLSLNRGGTLKRLLLEAAQEAATVGSTGSRLLSGHHPWFDAAEIEFARFTGHESALLFHSGYAANAGVLQMLLSARDTVFCDRLCHASLLDGIRLSGARRYYFNHNDLNHLEDQIKKRTDGSSSNVWIVTESVFSMDGDKPELEALVNLAEQHGILLYLDEAHAVGTIGSRGEGLAASLGLQQRIAVTVYPCGKAPGLAGAFVCGTNTLRESLINRCRSFIFSTAQPPLLAEILRRVIGLLPAMTSERGKLVLLSNEFRRRLIEMGLGAGTSTTHIVPVSLGESNRSLRWMKHLMDSGIDVRAVRPPTVPDGTARLRVNLQAAHTLEDLDRLSKELYSLLALERS